MHTAPKACLLYMLLEQYAFQIWSRSIFNLDYSRLSMVQDHVVLTIESRPKSHKKHSSILQQNLSRICETCCLNISEKLSSVLNCERAAPKISKDINNNVQH